MGGLFGGGGGEGETIQPPIRQDTPLQQDLINFATAQMAYARPFAGWGAGYHFMPHQLFGQTYMPGPNQTIFGNPYDQGASVPYYGAPAAPPQNLGFQPAAGGVPQWYNMPMPFPLSAAVQQAMGGGQQQGGQQQGGNQNNSGGSSNSGSGSGGSSSTAGGNSGQPGNSGGSSQSSSGNSRPQQQQQPQQQQAPAQPMAYQLPPAPTPVLQAQQAHLQQFGVPGWSPLYPYLGAGGMK